MSILREHSDWLSLLDISGPFLSLPILQRVFPQGIEPTTSGTRSDLRAAYAHWMDEKTKDPGIHRVWVRWVLTGLLEFSESQLAEGPRIPAGCERHLPEHHETLRPDIAVLSPEGKPVLLVCIHPPAQQLTKPLRGAFWKASPDTRMTELLRGTGIPLGLVTNGESWMLVHAPQKETAGYATWLADLWLQEPVTLRAFVSLLRAGRFFGVAENERLPALLRDSAQDQADVTDQLGAQVRAAVQVLVQAFDKLDAESSRTLLAGVNERALYESALTVMMRLVFLLFAEERGIIGHGYKLYLDSYALSGLLETLQEKADRHGEEILERACDAWSRLLAVFRVVYGGVAHADMRLPAYGGTLFDPDRFPFLEGRTAGTSWKTDAAKPLKVNNRVVLHLLRALQFIESKLPGGGDIAARRLSFRGLDIEQIGHVYEGLLDHTARRAATVTLGLAAAKGRIATVPLERLEKEAAESPEKLIEHLVEHTERSESSLRNALGSDTAKPRRGRKTAAPSAEPLITPAEEKSAVSHAILAACDHDLRLAARVAPFAALLREDTFHRPIVILPDSLYVAPGSDRRSTGTHYTPRSLTEPIVQHTLEPLVYHGPAEGLPRGEWRLKAPREILALKICDLAMGSGAFLVGVCRYLSARLVEAWEEALRDGDSQPSLGAGPRPIGTNPFAQPPAIVLLNDGSVAREGALGFGAFADHTVSLLPAEEDARLHLAARAIADRCLYGVDINAMAVEMAKLSLWLITVDRERPFTFLDHALKCGDSLLGVSTLDQIRHFDLSGDWANSELLLVQLRSEVNAALTARRTILRRATNGPEDVRHKIAALAEADEHLSHLRCAADLLIAAELGPGNEAARRDRRLDTRLLVNRHYRKTPLPEFQRLARAELQGRRPFHWPLEFLEVFDSGENGGRPAGFDAFVGNPPFMGGQKITGELGTDYRDYLVAKIAGGQRGIADFCAYFFVRVHSLLNLAQGMAGLVATNTIAQGDSREVGLEKIVAAGGSIPRAISSRPWPGVAALEVAHVWFRRGVWAGEWMLDDRSVSGITPFLTEPGSASGKPFRLVANAEKSFIGSYVLGLGFVLTPDQAQSLIAHDKRNTAVLFPYLNGEDLNSRSDQSPSRWVINFHDWPLARDADGLWLGAGEKERETWLKAGQVPFDYPHPVAADYPLCLEIVERLVKPQRLAQPDEIGQRCWWRYLRIRQELYAKIRDEKFTLVRARIANIHSMFMAPCGWIYNEKVVVFPGGSFPLFQSNIHEIWAREYSSTLKADMQYTPSDCCETFPFPEGLTGANPTSQIAHLTALGERYHEHRRQLMQARGEGLTKTYNRFHTRGAEGEGADIAELRTLHRQLDTAVAAAYGWADLAANDGAALGHDFHETKQGLRYTLAPTARREILDRLLALNHQRHAEEVAAGLHDKKSGKRKPDTGKKKRTSANPIQADLIPPAQGDLFDPPPTAKPFVPQVLPSVAAYVPPLAPTGKRIAAPREDFRVNLLRGILAAGGGSLPFDVLRDAFVLATRPALMRDFALAENSSAAAAWAKRREKSAEAVEPCDFLPALRQLGSNNLLIIEGPSGLIIGINGNPNPTLPKEAAYDGWLALEIAKALAPQSIPLEGIECSSEEARAALAA